MSPRFLIVFMLLCGVITACTTGSDPGIINTDTDGDDTETEISTDGDVSETEVEADKELLARCDPTKHTPTKSVSVKEGGQVLYCNKDDDDLNGAKMKIEGKLLTDPINLEIVKGEDLKLDGWKGVGTSIYFHATKVDDGVVELGNNVGFTIPFNPDELDKLANDYHINVLFKLDADHGTKNGDDNVAYLLPKSPSSFVIDHERGLLSLRNVYFGTYQVVIPSNIKEPVDRRYTYKGLSGVSMGACAASMNGFKYHDKFDIIAPLGGVMDNSYLINMLYNFNLGGFCTYEQITTKSLDGSSDVRTEAELEEFVTTGPENEPKCGWCGLQKDPNDWSNPTTHCYMTEPRERFKADEHAQGFNHWYYDDNGGNFNRSENIDMLQDLCFSFGNLTNYNPESTYLAAGLTGDRLTYFLDNIYNPNSTYSGCEELATWMKTSPLEKFYDKEFNPEGKYPVIMFCDGIGNDGTTPDIDEGRSGTWDPKNPRARSQRTDFLLAVDFNKNGVRDFGEPVIRQFWEPYEDCGTDGKCSKDEAGYDKDTNPDPAGDDYDWEKNPLGTEGNWVYDEGEKFDDYGLDGVPCPTGETCEYDACVDKDGKKCEGNGKFDYNPNVATALDLDARNNALKMTTDELTRVNVWMDAGIRDIFNFVLMGDNLGGALEGKLADLNLKTSRYNGFPALQTPNAKGLGDFDFLKVNYNNIGHNSIVRYGNYDATDAEIKNGDGRHVGIVSQVIYRVQTLYGFANVRFANGDFEPKETFAPGELIRSYTYDSPVLKRKNKYSVALPPGYFENNVDGGDGKADTCVNRYPVVYLMHGYGMAPDEFSYALTIMFGYMTDGIMQKIITVFPDGLCYTPKVCREDCEGDCHLEKDEKTCVDKCVVDNDCANVASECLQGTFYLDHQATMANPVGKADNDGWKPAQGSQALLELSDYIDNNFCTKKEETVKVDGTTFEALY